jgi:hypothetical protein
LSIEGHEVATRPAEYVLDQNGYVSIDLWGLFDDMERASNRYLAKVESDASARTDCLRRFDQIFVHPY